MKRRPTHISAVWGVSLDMFMMGRLGDTLGKNIHG